MKLNKISTVGMKMHLHKNCYTVKSFTLKKNPYKRNTEYIFIVLFLVYFKDSAACLDTCQHLHIKLNKVAGFCIMQITPFKELFRSYLRLMKTFLLIIFTG